MTEKMYKNPFLRFFFLEWTDLCTLLSVYPFLGVQKYKSANFFWLEWTGPKPCSETIHFLFWPLGSWLLPHESSHTRVDLSLGDHTILPTLAYVDYEEPTELHRNNDNNFPSSILTSFGNSTARSLSKHVAVSSD